MGFILDNMHYLLIYFRDADVTNGLALLGMAAVKQLTTQDLLFPFKDSFHSKVEINSLIAVLEQNQLLKKKEKKLLQRVDETAKKSFVFNKLYSAGQSLSVDRLIKLFTETENEQNVHFSKALQSIVSSAPKPAAIGWYTVCMRLKA